jgi:hypothetical protein
MINLGTCLFVYAGRKSGVMCAAFALTGHVTVPALRAIVPLELENRYSLLQHPFL